MTTINSKIYNGLCWKTCLCWVIGSSRDSKNNDGDSDASSKHVHKIDYIC